MPIQFQPPGPGGSFPGMGMEVGKGQAILQSLPVLQRAMAEAAQARTAGAAISQRAAEASGRMALGQQENNLKAMMFGVGQANDIAQQQMAIAAQAQAQQQRFEQQRQLEFDRITLQDQADNLKYQRAFRALDDDLRNGVISPEDHSNARQRLSLGYDPLAAKLTRSRLREQDAQTRMVEEQAGLVSRLRNGQTGSNLGFWHQTANQLAGNANPQPGGIQAIPVYGTDGQVLGHQVLSPEGKTTWAQKEATIRGLQAKDFSDLATKAWGLAEAALTQEVPDDTDPSKTKKVKPDITKIAPEAKKILGEFLAMVDEEHEKRKPGYKPPAPLSPPAPSQAAGSVGDMGRRPGMGVSNADKPVEGMSAPVQNPTPEFKAFDLAKPDSRSKEQEEAVTILRKYQDKVAGSDLPPPDKQRWSGAVDHMLRSLAQYGSYGNLPPEEKRLHDNVLRVLDGLKAAPKPPKPVLPESMLKPAPDLHLQGGYTS